MVQIVHSYTSLCALVLKTKKKWQFAQSDVQFLSVSEVLIQIYAVVSGVDVLLFMCRSCCSTKTML